MRRTKAVSLGEAIQEFLKQPQLCAKINESRLMHQWPSVVGPNVQSYTRSLEIHQGVLYVRVSSTALANNLAMSRASLVQRLNQSVGAVVIKDIQFNRK